jgi:predicted MFS family arabinose efflux permease
VVESGPFTTLEQAMFSEEASGRERTRVFGLYNAIATVAGSLGALAAGGPSLLRDQLSGAPADERFFLVLVPAGIAGMMIALSLSGDIETAPRESRCFVPLRTSRRNVVRLSGLFALDAFGGGFIVQSFIAYWFSLKYDVSTEVLGAVFFAVGMLQSVSFIAATRIADRIGLLNTMVFTHLPSNVLLAAIPLAPSLGVAIALLLGRFAVSQMDVPTRQAYVAALIPADERTAAVAYTNSARYATRPIGAALAGTLQQAAVGLPFFIGGGIKIVYDLSIWLWFRRVDLPEEGPAGK